MRSAPPSGNWHASKTTLVLLVRHGQTSTTGVTLPGRAPGLHMANRGRKEADDVAGRIARLPRVAGIYSSPLERAHETATPIGTACGFPVMVESGLLERYGFIDTLAGGPLTLGQSD